MENVNWVTPTAGQKLNVKIHLTADQKVRNIIYYAHQIKNNYLHYKFRVSADGI